MSTSIPSPQSTDDPLHAIQQSLAGLGPLQRRAFTAGMAERFLPVYEAFARREKWGDPKLFRRSLDAVWDHLEGKAISVMDLDRSLSRIEEGTPHMDDFEEAHDALAAAVMVHEAVESCRSSDNQEPAIQAAMSGFEAFVPGWADEPEGPRTAAQKNKLAKEFKGQTRLLEAVAKVDKFNQGTIQALRRQILEFKIKPPGKSAGTGPALIPNQTLFEQYRRMVEADIRSSGQRWKGFEIMPDMRPMLLFSRWAARYSRRKQTIDGSYGRPADSMAQEALVSRNKAIDAKAKGMLDWKPLQRSTIERSLGNPYSGIDARSVDEPHGYGPSVRRLWLDAKGRGLSNEEAWEELAVWAEHRPAAWDLEDQRKKKRISANVNRLAGYLSRTIHWTRTDEAAYPWEAMLDGHHWKVRLNDFPDDYMYSLIVSGEDQGSFHDWPDAWQRE